MTFELFFWIVVSALAIDNFTQILTKRKLFRWFRQSFKKACIYLHCSSFKKLAYCKFCQSCWLSLIVAAGLILFPGFVPLKIFLVWMAMHRIVQFFNEFFIRYLGRAPIGIFGNIRLIHQDDNTK